MVNRGSMRSLASRCALHIPPNLHLELDRLYGRIRPFQSLNSLRQPGLLRIVQPVGPTWTLTFVAFKGNCLSNYVCKWLQGCSKNRSVHPYICFTYPQYIHIVKFVSIVHIFCKSLHVVYINLHNLSSIVGRPAFSRCVSLCIGRECIFIFYVSF